MSPKYIHTFSGIHAKNFNPTNRSWIKTPSELTGSVNYKEHISGIPLRRLSSILKSALATAQVCIKSMNDIKPNGIIMATGLGCLHDTQKFLIDFKTNETPLPTAFIHSTHNTIAGQLGLHLKCHGYNITHAHDQACFEHALLDVSLKDLSADDWMLVGGIDEKIDWLDQFQQHFNSDLTLGFGTSLFAVSGSKSPNAVCLEKVEAKLIGKNKKTNLVAEFIGGQEVDLILTNGSYSHSTTPTINYQDHSGAYYTNSAFGMEMAIQHLRSDANRVLIINELTTEQIGLTMLSNE